MTFLRNLLVNTGSLHKYVLVLPWPMNEALGTEFRTPRRCNPRRAPGPHTVRLPCAHACTHQLRLREPVALFHSTVSVQPIAGHELLFMKVAPTKARRTNTSPPCPLGLHLGGEDGRYAAHEHDILHGATP